jgi:hypothetical protein
MVATHISDLFHFRNRFLRSVNLERDFPDPAALRGYLATPPAIDGLGRLSRGLAPRSSQRAWRVTGDYGTGKSSFALALARLLTGDSRSLPVDIRRAVDFRTVGGRPSLLPVLITGSQAPIAPCLLRALAQVLEDACSRGRRPRLIDRIRATAESRERDDRQAVDLITDAAKYLRQSGKRSGLLIVLDEMGKFLEYAALHAEHQDIYFLQILAEAAARSGDAPVLVVGLLHQGFSAYAEQLSHAAQREWEKVAGRYDEVLFDQPLEQTATLVANALGIAGALPAGVTTAAERDMTRAIEIGWYGSPGRRLGLVDLAARLYPLHPTLVPVLVRLFSRFGQNERSLFSFLLSDEPHALQAFASSAPSPERFYRLHHLYDYARIAFGHRLAVRSYNSHWNQIESVIESFPSDRQFELGVLKTVAILNLIDDSSLLASEDVLALAVSGSFPEGTRRAKATLRDLRKGKGVLYFRGAAGGYCLWPHTSVNLERAYHEATRAVPVSSRVGAAIRGDLETRPLVARRHYIESGNLRHFLIQYVSPADLPTALGPAGAADGLVLVALCETQADRVEALRFARSASLRGRTEVLVAVPQPLSGLAHLLAEAQRWEWVSDHIPELNHDSYALEEVTRQLAACRQVLAKRVQGYVGLRSFSETIGLEWFHCGHPAKLTTGRALLEQLSRICDQVFAQAPRVRNELINRHTLSSAAAAARLRLIERLLQYPGEPFLGMDPETKPPEMSMYLSVLKAAGLHREERGVWAVTEPVEGEDPCNVRPILQHMVETLEKARGARVPVTDLVERMRRPPFGVRDGMAPLILAVLAVLHEQDVAFYENGAFLRQMSGQAFQRLIKAPEAFEVQYCTIAGIRSVVFERLLKVLNPDRARSEKVNLLDVVRPLCTFAAQLPPYVHKTAALSREATAVREALLRAEEPAALLFRNLPAACGIEPFESDEPPALPRVRRFVDKLRVALDDLRSAYPELLRRIKEEVVSVFGRPGGFSEARSALATSAERVLVSVSEPRLKALCLRFVDRALAEQEWIESLGSFVCAKPPTKWSDLDWANFRDELSRLARQFLRVESTTFIATKGGQGTRAMRVAITSQDGTEVEQVVYLDAAEEARAAEIEGQVGAILQKTDRIGVVATSRALGKALAAAKPGSAENASEKVSPEQMDAAGRTTGISGGVP